jgi:hypothetical protein
VKLARFRKTKVMYFHSHVEDRSNTNTGTITYTYKYIQNMFLKVGLIEENKEGKRRKE